MTTFKVGDPVTVKPPYDSPHIECSPHAYVARVDGDRYMIGCPTWRLSDGRPLLFGPYTSDRFDRGHDPAVNRL